MDVIQSDSDFNPTLTKYLVSDVSVVYSPVFAESCCVVDK